MPRVQCIQLAGCHCWFNTNDHPPPHFHVKDTGGDWELRIFFLLEPVECEEVFRLKKVPARLKRRIMKAARDHRLELFREWDRTVQSE